MSNDHDADANATLFSPIHRLTERFCSCYVKNGSKLAKIVNGEEDDATAHDEPGFGHKINTDGKRECMGNKSVGRGRSNHLSEGMNWRSMTGSGLDVAVFAWLSL